MSPEERLPMRRSSTRDRNRRSGGTCFLLAASDYTCTADGGIRKSGDPFEGSHPQALGEGGCSLEAG
ncbi:hypothetical protein JZ751_028854 [Albula glossodonta]|uniref:Uncharacterized protein n=1 Tax=Albula glossodonta TaxID=121402 RepID=A0A8T2NBS3_9TELE|nr:hypothetical protein JZ751_028854 [Albula glossodonta]